MEKEIWKDIKGYEGLYQVSNMGRIKSLWFNKEKILKQAKRKDGYLDLCLCKDGEQKSYLVHRLVAQAFITNPENKPHIDHIDTNKQNNNVNNLRWCSPQENMNNPITKIKNSQTHKGRVFSQETKEKLSIALKGKNKGKIVSQETKEKLSIALKGRILSQEWKEKIGKSRKGIKHTQESKEKISKANKGRVLSQEWKDKISKSNSKPILQLSKSGLIIIKKWDSAKQVEIELGIDNSNIIKCCKGKKKTAKGYRWMYYEEYVNRMNKYFDAK